MDGVERHETARYTRRRLRLVAVDGGSIPPISTGTPAPAGVLSVYGLFFYRYQIVTSVTVEPVGMTVILGGAMAHSVPHRAYCPTTKEY